MDELTFSLEQLEELATKVKYNQELFQNSIEEMNNIITELNNYWISDETNTYETFKNLYSEKYKKLQEANTMIRNFSETLEDKKNLYREAAQRTINNFE